MQMNTYTPPPTALDDPIKKLRAIIKNLTREEKDARTGKRNRTPPDERLRIVNELLTSDVAEPLHNIDNAVLAYCEMSQKQKKENCLYIKKLTDIIDTLAEYLTNHESNQSRKQGILSKKTERKKKKFDVELYPYAQSGEPECDEYGRMLIMSRSAQRDFEDMLHQGLFDERGYERTEFQICFLDTLSDTEQGLCYLLLENGSTQTEAGAEVGLTRQNVRTLWGGIKRKFVSYQEKNNFKKYA